MVDPPLDDTIAGYRMFIDGAWVEADDGDRLTSSSPFTGRVWATAPLAGKSDVDGAVRAAVMAREGDWGRLTATERGRLLHRLADLIDAEAEHLARIETTDNGKVLRETRAQVASLSAWYRYFGGYADKIEGTAPATTKDGIFTYVLQEPVGVVAAILPWNSPLLLMTFKAAPALAAGCTMVVKPSEQTPISTLEFARLVEQAGFPPGVFNVITGDRRTGELLTGHPGVDKIAFTGSTASGSHVMRAAASHVARVTLELGGKSPNIVFGDADLAAAVDGVVAGVYAATGQTCIAGSRLLVDRRIQQSFLDALVARTTAIRLGDPSDLTTEMGPCATPEQLEKVAGMVARARADGARVLCGGHKPASAACADGYFFEPTILVDVAQDMEIVQEEVFGPVLVVIPFDTEAEAVAIANDTRYGLGAGVWTRDLARAHRVAHAIRSGTVWVNCYRLLSYNVPFGGVKMSGLGRENGSSAMAEYLEPKAVWINLTDQARDPFVMG